MNRILFCLILLTNIASAQVDLSLGLRAYYPFSGNANDVSGNNNNPVFNNATLTADRNGIANSAYHFDGSTNYMRIINNPSINMTNKMSIAAWVKPMGFYSGTCHNNMLLSKGDADYLTGNYSLRYTPDPLSGCVSNPPLSQNVFYSVNSIATTPFVELNKWYSVVWTSDGITANIYVDCQLRGSVPAGSFSFTNSFDLYFGKMNNGTFPYWLNGDLDEIRIYDRALNQEEVNVLGGCNATIPCNNWLNTPTEPSFVNIGNLNVTGNIITVEALINRTQAYTGGIGNGNEGDVVSKHDSPSDVNYLLRPNHAYITTNNGFFGTPDICEIEINKIYHVAMVYDGTTLKFYRNGFLMSQVAATGSLFQNSWPTRIGRYTGTVTSSFLGYTNEVRIWNVARTQTEIRAYMNNSLPAPTTQTGLLAYYTFDNLLNKQGNPAWNGTLGGAASINATIPNCNFFIDSCVTRTSIGNIINDYTPVIALNSCENKITVEDATAYNAGDTVLLIQMKGAIIDSTNTAAFGTITDYKNAGNYEFNYVKSKTGNIIELKNILTRQYDIPLGKVQLVRVPYYENVNIASTLTCLPWDGSKGGVLVLNVQDSINLNADIDVSGKGFKRGIGYNSGNATLNCFQNNFHYPQSSNAIAGQKGESIVTLSSNINFGKGNAASGGGGGLGHNSGGGGGSNGGAGGFGGYQLDACGSSPFDNRGIGGSTMNYSSSLNRVFLGGGGGAGQADNPGNIPPSGGNGGGIAILLSEYLKTNTHKIISNGDNATPCATPPSTDCHDGMGGGGAAGSILLSVNQYLDNLTAENKGGNGADMVGSVLLGGRIGGGGGGGGGLLFITNSSLPASINNLNAGGFNGVLAQDAGNAWGSTLGQTGTAVFNLVIPISSLPFQPNIDSVRFNHNGIGCSTFDFEGLGYTNTNPILDWQWYFGDGNTANTQNTSHTYSANGTYTVKLIVTDINGCKDSISRDITAGNALDFDFNYQTDVCDPLSIQFTGIGTDIQNPYWSFGDGATVTGILNPVHVYAATGTYIVRYSINNGVCTDTINKTIDITFINDNIILTLDTTICAGTTKQLLTTAALGFCWSPITYLDNPNSPNPITSTPENITYYYTAEVQGSNIITNGDFSGGNTGFTSAYNYATPNVTEGQYYVGPNAQAWNASLSNCSDHTTGTGNMMLINGSPVADVNVWRQTVTVAPNTNYAFSTWVQALWPPNPAQLKFSINGNDVGALITASLPTCTWTQFYTTWNSGTATSADISIVNKNIAVIGNDFALDDIVFAPVIIKRDSVKITVDTPLVKTTDDLSACEGVQVQLTTTGASVYSWSPTSGLTNSSISNPIATPATSTQYIVTGTNINGCIAKDTVNISINPKPVVITSNDTTICQAGSAQLAASGGISYSWSPVATLNNSSAPNPTASPVNTTTYYVTVTDNNNCTNNDSVKVNVRSLNNFSIDAAAPICLNKSVQLNANGGDLYSWQPASSLNNPGIFNPTASPRITTTYSVLVTDTICGNASTLSTTVTVLPLPAVTAGKSNDIDCSTAQSQLNANGAMQYSWSPAASLNNSNTGNPIASPAITTQYIVTGTNAAGCVNYDSVTVKVSADNKGGYLMPTAFTPNNDGKNDCYRIKYWGTILELEFSIYNRWGERVFFTRNPNDCWDGRYKGELQNPAVFIYMIKAKTTCVNEVFRKGTFTLIR